MAIIAAGRKITPGTILRPLAALLVGVVAALLLGEGLLRAAGLGHPHFSSPDLYRVSSDPRILFEPRPNFDGYSEGTTVRTNSRGLRERELPLAPGRGTARVLFLGDSVTFGSGVLAEEAFPRLLESALGDAGAGPIETLNAGVVGYNTLQELGRLEAVGLAYGPDLVVLTFVVNDLLESFSIFDHQYVPSPPFAGQKVWLRKHSHLYRFIQGTYWRIAQDLRRARSAPTEPLRKRERMDERLLQLGQIVDRTRASGARFFLLLYPDNLGDPVSPGPSGERLTVRQELLRFAERERVPVLDLTDALGDVNDPRARHFRLREDPHPSPAGHRAIAAAAQGPLFDVLRERVGAR